MACFEHKVCIKLFLLLIYFVLKYYNNKHDLLGFRASSYETFSGPMGIFLWADTICQSI